MPLCPLYGLKFYSNDINCIFKTKAKKKEIEKSIFFLNSNMYRSVYSAIF